MKDNKKLTLTYATFQSSVTYSMFLCLLFNNKIHKLNNY